MLMKNLTPAEAEMLVMKGVIRKGTGLTIRGLSKNDSDEYIVSKIGKLKDCIVFYVYNGYKECQYKVKQSAILKVDEMDVHKLVDAYNGSSTDDVLEVMESTNVERSIIGKKCGELDGQKLENGMRIMLTNDKNDKLNDKILVVKGVGESIVLAPNRGRPKKKLEE